MPNRPLHLRSVGPGGQIRTLAYLSLEARMLGAPEVVSGGRPNTDSSPLPIMLRDVTGNGHSTMGGGRVGFRVSCRARNWRFDFERYLRQRHLAPSLSRIHILTVTPSW